MNVLIAIEEPDFTGIVERQSRFASRVAWALLRNAHDVEDVVQETFLKLYRTGSWKRIDDERAFLARVVWRTASDRLRSRTREKVTPEPRRGPHNPEEAAISANWTNTVHRILEALPEDLRQPLALSSIEELNSREIAQVMGIAESTVRTRILRARRLLRRKLAGAMFIALVLVASSIAPERLPAPTTVTVFKAPVPASVIPVKRRVRNTIALESALVAYLEKHPREATHLLWGDEPVSIEPITIEQLP